MILIFQVPTLNHANPLLTFIVHKTACFPNPHKFHITININDLLSLITQKDYVNKGRNKINK
jgi:hypothetical protein